MVPSGPTFGATKLRLVRPPVDYSGVGEAIVRLAELATRVHQAQMVRGCTPTLGPGRPGWARGTGLRLTGSEWSDGRDGRSGGAR
ncbi:MAG: hypothetical protein AB7K52_01025 [Phycisphaerales bacterium]